MMPRKPMRNLPIQTANQSGARAFAASSNGQGGQGTFMTQTSMRKQLSGPKNVSQKPTQTNIKSVNPQKISEARIEGYKQRIAALQQQAEPKRIFEEYGIVIEEAEVLKDSLAAQTMRNEQDQYALRVGMKPKQKGRVS